MVAALTTAGTYQVFGEAITDPVLIIAKVPNPIILVAGLAAIAYYYAMRNHPSLARKGLKDVRSSEGAMHGEPAPATDETEAEDEDAAGQHRDSTDGETGTGTSER